jgi:hypothetical protein
MSVWLFRAHLVLGLVLIGLGVGEFVRGGLGLGLTYVAFGIAWFVIAFLRRKGILPTARTKPPQPSPYADLPD